MKQEDTYKEVKVFEFPNMTVRVHQPILAEDERARRMKAIKKAAASLLRDLYAKEMSAKKA